MLVRWSYGSRWDAAPQAVTGNSIEASKAASSARAPPVARARPAARTPSRSHCVRGGRGGAPARSCSRRGRGRPCPRQLGRSSPRSCSRRSRGQARPQLRDRCTACLHRPHVPRPPPCPVDAVEQLPPAHHYGRGNAAMEKKWIRQGKNGGGNG
jgi:hypothetical protein